ncbi:MAG: 4-hydroxy-tetrahydrodipicolinate reductase [Clostridia bacterium]|nr:4-hydroxy-tetrahydrodipicolinate reductase [Clostridia bacterium]
MINIMLNGVLGKMGEAIVRLISEREDVTVSCGVDPAFSGQKSFPFPVFTSPEEIPEETVCDVIIDFSHFSAVPALLKFALKRSIPVVLCTTGLPEETKKLAEEASRKIGVFSSANMSLGVYVLRKLAKDAAILLGEDFDIEIVEKHHNNKLDAPSGTALAIADTLNDARNGSLEYTYDRHSRRAKRNKSEVGISSVRGGNIVGDHEVIFAGRNEVIELTHRAQSREVFADGALKAAVFMAGRPAGKYDMEDLFK